MRALALLSLALVAACQMETAPADSAAADAAVPAAEAPAPPTDAPGPEPLTAAPEVPERFRGTWDASPQACAGPAGPTRWEVGGLQVRGLPGVAEVMTVDEDGPRVVLETLFFAEGSAGGDPEPQEIALELGPSGDALSLSAFGRTDAKVRCAAGA